MLLAAGLGLYPSLAAGRLASLTGLLGAVGVACAITAVLARGLYAAGALFSLAAEYVLAEVTGHVPPGSVIAYAVGLILVCELLLWAAWLPRRARADRAVAVRYLAWLAAMAAAAALLALAVLAAASLRLPSALVAAVLGIAAAVALLALPWLLGRGAGGPGPGAPAGGEPRT